MLEFIAAMGRRRRAGLSSSALTIDREMRVPRMGGRRRGQHPKVYLWKGKSGQEFWKADWRQYIEGQPKPRHRSRTWPISEFTKSEAQERCDRLVRAETGGPPEETDIEELLVAQAVIEVDQSRKLSAPGNYVYLIEAPAYLKIGTTEDPPRRLRDLQIANHAVLKLRRVFSGDGRLEQRLHKIFASFRKHGEWFVYNSTLQAFVERTGSLNVSPSPIPAAAVGGD